jgi:D-amino-acid oxidase
MRALVIGAGVSGLSCAIRLLEAGHAVTIWARGLHSNTTSAVAAAIWYPYRADPLHRVLPWGEATLREFTRLSAEPETGIVMRDGLEVFRERVGDPWWRHAVPGFRRATPDELPPGFIDGYAMRLPVIDMSLYLGWLEGRVMARGTALERRSITSFDEAEGVADLVVNCTGLGAREVARDAEVFGVRGQVQVVEAPNVSTFMLDEATLTYIIPRVFDVVLGGTAEEGVEDTEADLKTADSIRERCTRLMPQLAGATTITDRVGIRPCRATVRLEAEVLPSGTRVIHNYGHGGSGVTLSWGCADEVARLV